MVNCLLDTSTWISPRHIHKKTNKQISKSLPKKNPQSYQPTQSPNTQHQTAQTRNLGSCVLPYPNIHEFNFCPRVIALSINLMTSRTCLKRQWFTSALRRKYNFLRIACPALHAQVPIYFSGLITCNLSLTPARCSLPSPRCPQIYVSGILHKYTNLLGFKCAALSFISNLAVVFAFPVPG